MSTDISLELLGRYENKLVWNLNQLCNFRCSYCFFPPEVLGKEHPAVGRHSIEHIKRSFDQTGREWLIMISGGEPFLYDSFVPLCELLSRDHHLQVTTNLSRGNVRDFADRIDPARVMIICASYHAAERERRGEKWTRDFIDRYVYLEERGFLVLANYVTDPPSFDRIRDDFDMLRDAGVTNLSTLTFRGEHEGRSYPRDYSERERELIVELTVDKRLEAEILDGLHFEGRPCNAGFRYLQMDPDGRLHRCCTILEDHGNLFEGTARFEDGPRPCTARACQDASLGVDSTGGLPTEAAPDPRLRRGLDLLTGR